MICVIRVTALVTLAATVVCAAVAGSPTSHENVALHRQWPQASVVLSDGALSAHPAARQAAALLPPQYGQRAHGGTGRMQPASGWVEAASICEPGSAQSQWVDYGSDYVVRRVKPLQRSA